MELEHSKQYKKTLLTFVELLMSVNQSASKNLQNKKKRLLENSRSSVPIPLSIRMEEPELHHLQIAFVLPSESNLIPTVQSNSIMILYDN